jgi:hypothetical protein
MRLSRLTLNLSRRRRITEGSEKPSFLMAVVTLRPGSFSITEAIRSNRSQSLMPVPFGRPLLCRRWSDIVPIRGSLESLALTMIINSSFAKDFNWLGAEFNVRPKIVACECVPEVEFLARIVRKNGRLMNINDYNKPSFFASPARSVSGRAPRWLMTSPAARLPSRAQVPKSIPRACPNRKPEA